MPTPTPRDLAKKTTPAAPPLLEVTEVSEESVDAFGELVFDPSRVTPLVLLSPDPRRPDGPPMIDPAQLSQDVGEQAQIAVLTDHAAATRLRNVLPELAVWGGAARIFHPGVRPGDPKRRHPLVLSSRGKTAIAKIKEVLTEPPTAPRKPIPANAVDNDVALQSQRRTIAMLRKENRRLTQRLDTAEQQIAGTQAVYADPEQQFRYEVEQCWLRRVPEANRANHPLIPYTVGLHFLRSAQETELVDRRKIVEVTVEILTGIAATNPARQVHRMRAREEGPKPRIRSDQAIAMRCHLKNDTAGAPRLMWWKLPDQSIELGRIAHHDDTHLP
ncbi:hypothetical protein [Streptomyces niveus]|uniref:hypothetical protein n=1 Tax=Streptomyces niveus TaxID=193462 RepID=UPI00344A9F5A